MLILKITGAIIIIISSTLIGIMKARHFEKRTGELRNIISMLQLLETEICYKSNLLWEALINCANIKKECSTAQFFKTASELLQSRDISSGDAWNEAIESNISKTNLSDEDKSILLGLGSSLGKSDYEGQIKNIRYIIKEIEGQVIKADKECMKYQSMYRKLGLLSGIAIVIMLF